MNWMSVGVPCIGDSTTLATTTITGVLTVIWIGAASCLLHLFFLSLFESWAESCFQSTRSWDFTKLCNSLFKISCSSLWQEFCDFGNDGFSINEFDRQKCNFQNSEVFRYTVANRFIQLSCSIRHSIGFLQRHENPCRLHFRSLEYHHT